MHEFRRSMLANIPIRTLNTIPMTAIVELESLHKVINLFGTIQDRNLETRKAAFLEII
jgi:hypothetical protein